MIRGKPLPPGPLMVWADRSPPLLVPTSISARSRSSEGIFLGVMACNDVNGCFGETDRRIHPARTARGEWEDHGERMHGGFYQTWL